MRTSGRGALTCMPTHDDAPCCSLGHALLPPADHHRPDQHLAPASQVPRHPALDGCLHVRARSPCAHACAQQLPADPASPLLRSCMRRICGGCAVSPCTEAARQRAARSLAHMARHQPLLRLTGGCSSPPCMERGTQQPCEALHGHRQRSSMWRCLGGSHGARCVLGTERVAARPGGGRASWQCPGGSGGRRGGGSAHACGSPSRHGRQEGSPAIRA